MNFSQKKVFLIFSVLVCLCFCSCETLSIKGTWKLVETKSLGYDDIYFFGDSTPNKRKIESYEGDYWTFFEDSLMYSRYPYFVERIEAYKLTDDSVYTDIYDGNYQYVIENDTLKMTLQGPKYTYYYYLVRVDVEDIQIDLLRKNLVDWSHFSGLWKYEPDENVKFLKCAPNILQELDLRESNSDAFYFEKDLLNYFSDNILYQFDFSYGDINEIRLSQFCDSANKYNWVTYKKLN